MSATLEAIAAAVPRPRTGRRTWLLPLIAVAVTVTAAVLSIQPWPVGVFQDDGIYAILGKALASGHGYRYLNLPGAPAATHYPPAYPLVLALLWRLAPEFPANTALFVFANVLFLALAALGAWGFGRRRLRLGPNVMFLVVLATVASAPVLGFSVYLLSEPMFMAAVFPVVLVAERAVDSERRRDALAAGLLAGGLAMIRTMGGLAAVGLVLVLLGRRRWLQALLAMLGAAVLLVPWQIWVGLHGGEVPAVLVGKYGSYSGWLATAVMSHGVSFVLRVLWTNVVQLHHLAWEMFTGAEAAHGALQQGISVLVSAFLAATIALGFGPLRRRAPVTGTFVVLYSAIVMIWPFEPVRFLWAILPLGGMLLAMGALCILRWRPPSERHSRLPILPRVFLVLLMLGYVRYNVHSVGDGPWQRGAQATAEGAAPLVKWAREHTDPGDLLATDSDPLVHLYTGRRTIPVGTFTPEEYLVPQTYDFATRELETLLDTYHPRWVMCSTSYCTIAARNLTEHQPPRLRFLGALERGAIFAPTAP